MSAALKSLPSIEKDVPLPTPIRRPALNSRELSNRILSCRQGDSFFIKTAEASRLQRNALVVAWQIRKSFPATRAKLRITTRSNAEGVRIWRVR